MAEGKGITKNQLTCGIAMPISEIDGCSEAHWNDVLKIVSEAVSEAGLKPNLVSEAGESGVIHKRIIQNLYDNPVLVCDVSSKNPNVMFELGIRLAFDKPTIIIKDDKTGYCFDSGVIEHLEYPRDLRFYDIVKFKNKLVEKIKDTYKKSKEDKNYSTFLKHFGTFTLAKIEEKEVTQNEYIFAEIKEIRRDIHRLINVRSPMSRREFKNRRLEFCFKGKRSKLCKDAIDIIKNNYIINEFSVIDIDDDHVHLVVFLPYKDMELGKSIEYDINELKRKYF